MSSIIQDSSINQMNCNNSLCEIDNSTHVPFWYEDPNILFNKDYILEFFPTSNMTYNQKLNAISRMVIILTIMSFIFSQNIRLLFVSAVTLLAIFLLHTSNETDKSKNIKKSIEGFDNSPGLDNAITNFDLNRQTGFNNPSFNNYTDPSIDFLNQNNIPISPNTFQQPSSTNPLSNVLLTDYDYNPNKKPAGPAYNQVVNNNILDNAKQLVQEANPDQPDISDKLFKDLGEQLNFEQSMRPFHSTANSQIPNDQGAFAEFCYGSMVSCKEGNLFACARNLSRHTNY